MNRTHNNGELRISDVGKTVELKGWVAKKRNLGALVFIDLRDRYGITQIVLNESMEEISREIKNEYVLHVVGKVIECKKIEGTHLSKCLVDIDSSNYLQIVCGANNVRENLMVVVATIGIIMNNGILISPTKLKGIDSYGMICSQKELNITGFNDNGIIELTNGKYHVGEIFKECYIDYDFK